jgi:hypothetical protein
MASFAVLARLFVTLHCDTVLPTFPSTMVLTTHITQMTVDRPFPNLQTCENLPQVLSTIINDIIHHFCLCYSDS